MEKENQIKDLRNFGEQVEDCKIDEVANDVLQRYKEAFLELAK